MLLQVLPFLWMTSGCFPEKEQTCRSITVTQIRKLMTLVIIRHKHMHTRQYAHHVVAYAALLDVSKWKWMLICWQGENCSGGCDPAPRRIRSPSPRSRRTLSCMSHPATWCHQTWFASPSCPMTAALKETCPRVLIPFHRYLWTVSALAHLGKNAKGKCNTSYFPLIRGLLLVSSGLLYWKSLW